jgi:diguanylate cyclase (GGDEF)-like protein
LADECGGRLLKEVGRRLGSRSSDTVARLGGGEFVVLLEDIGDDREATLAADRIRKELEVSFEVGRRELSVTASIGVAVGPSSGGGPRELLRNADLAMYRAKENDKNRHEVYDPTSGSACAHDRLTLAPASGQCSIGSGYLFEGGWTAPATRF